jgi:hypothetical protein
MENKCSQESYVKIFILFTAENKTYFENCKEFVTALRTVGGETCGRFEELHWNGK